MCFRYCGIRDPSWAELYHFVNFLNIQLRDCEKSVFCNPALVGDLLQGFRTFAVRFMIQMSRVSLSCDNTVKTTMTTTAVTATIIIIIILIIIMMRSMMMIDDDDPAFSISFFNICVSSIKAFPLSSAVFAL